MDTKFNYAAFFRAMCIMVFLVVVLSNTGLVLAAGASPFVGHWQATDPIDGSEVQMIIAGPPNGPFNITQTDSYISFCDGGPGIIRGEGWINEFDSYMLEADLHIECFTTGAALDFHWVWLYHPSTNTLTNMWNGKVFVWSKSGPPQAPPQPLGLRVNYGEGGWVESFYEAGHTVWITVTESDGVTVKATAQVYTEPRSEWDGEEGFQTTFEDWDPAPPDIEPYDWVYGWVDNGASALVQIGDISGFIDFESDTIRGTVDALWFSGDEEITIECHPWGAPEPLEVIYAAVKPNGEDEYSCSWSPDWEFNLGQDIGVGYIGPDGHWVANAFYSYARIVASESGNWFWTTDFAPYTYLDIALYESSEPGAELIWSGVSTDPTDESGFTSIGLGEEADFLPGNYLVVSDHTVLKGMEFETIYIDTFDISEDYMDGTAPLGRNVLAAAGYQDYQDTIWVVADESTGSWFADFNGRVDIDEEMRTWSWASIYDQDWDANEGSTPPQQIVFLRPACGSEYTVEPGSPVEIRYGSWAALGVDLASQNAEHLTVELVFNGEPVTGTQHPVVPLSKIPCTSSSEDIFGVYYTVQVGPLEPGTYVAEVTYILDEAVWDGYNWYGPGVFGPHEFTLTVP